MTEIHTANRANRWFSFWFRWCDRDDLKEIDLIVLQVLVFLRELKLGFNFGLQCWKNIQGGIYCCLNRLMWFPQMIWFTSLGLDVDCLQHIKDVCNTCRRYSHSSGVGSTWFETCLFHSWEPQKCSCAPWTSQARWKYKLITVKLCRYTSICILEWLQLYPFLKLC